MTPATNAVIAAMRVRGATINWVPNLGCGVGKPPAFSGCCREGRAWLRLHENLLAELHAAGALGWSRTVIDGSHLRAMEGGPKPGRARSTVPELARNIT